MLLKSTKREIAKKIAPEYRKASKKGKIIDELIHLIGHHRTYASWLLLHHGFRVKPYVFPRPSLLRMVGREQMIMVKTVVLDSRSPAQARDYNLLLDIPAISMPEVKYLTHLPI